MYDNTRDESSEEMEKLEKLFLTCRSNEKVFATLQRKLSFSPNGFR